MKKGLKGENLVNGNHPYLLNQQNHKFLDWYSLIVFNLIVEPFSESLGSLEGRRGNLLTQVKSISDLGDHDIQTEKDP